MLKSLPIGVEFFEEFKKNDHYYSDLLLKTGDVFAKAFVIELKTVKQTGKKPVTMEMMDEAADEAIRQIDGNAYTDALLEEGYGNIGRYGISFFKKRCRVHYKDGYSPS